MNAKDLSTDSALGARIDDGSTKYAQSGNLLQNNSNKSYQDIGTNSLAKVDVQTSRPCAIIGPDRVLPSPNSDVYVKKNSVESWPCSNGIYRQYPDYPHKMSEYQPTRNISPRQTFQENMQRIMVTPYNSMKINDDPNFTVDRNITMMKNAKRNISLETKYCEVPYTVNPVCNEQKSVSEMPVTSPNPTVTRSASHSWLPNNVNIRPLRPYGAPELYQYPDYPSCVGSRPMPIIRPHRTVHDEPGRIYPEQYYQDPNVRYRPYPPTKERYTHARYDYISNYSNTFHPPSRFPPHAFDSQKSVPTHAYPLYPQAPVKYIDRRTGEAIMDGYQRPNPQANLNVTYRNPIIHPPYGPLQANCVQNNMFSYPDNSSKLVTSNKLPYSNNKLQSTTYIDYEIPQNKKNNIAETVYLNDVNRTHSIKGEVRYPNYSPVNMHSVPQHPLYRKENVLMKSFEYMPHQRNLDPSVNFHNPLLRRPIHFSPNAIAISPSDSNTSNDTTQTHSTNQEDCGYVSQSSSTSIRSIESHISGVPHEYNNYRSSDYRYGFLPRNIPTQIPNKSSKMKKDLDVRQFLQMWNEGDDESGEQNKDETIPKDSNNFNSLPSQYEIANKQEQLYVLGLVNVPSEELGNYEHIQKISKLPENIKGYNSIELLNQFEEAIESSNVRNYNSKPNREYNAKSTMSQQSVHALSRPVSPLDVEAKISQSVIHKEVGCNFEIKPCSPKMLNVEIATPIKNILDERIIEKVSNPIVTKPIVLQKTETINIENSNFSNSPHCENSLKENVKVQNCTMDNLKYTNVNSTDPIKGNYSLQDLVYNSSVCLASLPRLDNDIELNFPEINQQFINANKIESIIPASVKDLPMLDSDQRDSTIAKNKTGQGSVVDHCSLNVESDKEITKLSKYRKIKKTDLEYKESQNSSKAYSRTDSVIIKNPDMTQNQEGENINTSNTCNIMIKNVQDIKEDYINSANLAEEKSAVSVCIESICINSFEEKDSKTSTEIAIDFSLNKSDNELLKVYPIKENIVNESLLNLIEDDLKISEAYENTEFSQNVNINKLMEVNDTVKPADDHNDNTNEEVSNDNVQENLKTDVEDLHLQSISNAVKTPSQKDLCHNKNNINLSDVTNASDIILDSSINGSYTEDHPSSEAMFTVEKKSHDCSENISSDVNQKIEIDGTQVTRKNDTASLFDEIHYENRRTNDDDHESKIYDRQNFMYSHIKDANKNFMMSPKSKINLTDINCENNQSVELEIQTLQRESECAIENKIELLEIEKKLSHGCQIFNTKEPIEEQKVYNTHKIEKCSQSKKRLYSYSIQNLIIFSERMSFKENCEGSVSQKGIEFITNKKCNKLSINNCVKIHLQNDYVTDLKLGSFLTATRNGRLDKSLSDNIIDTNYAVITNDNEKEHDSISAIDNFKMNMQNENNQIIDEDTGNNNVISKINNDSIVQIMDPKPSNVCSLKYGTEETVLCNRESILSIQSTSEDSELLSSKESCNYIKEKETDNNNEKEILNIPEKVFTNSRIRIKRSLSDSALNRYINDDLKNGNSDRMFIIPRKRKKINPCEMMEPNLIADDDLCNIIQTNRRNSISTFYNEENVSFCILIDNSCVLTEETEESPKICLAEISEEYEDDFKDDCSFTTENALLTDKSCNGAPFSLSENKFKEKNANFVDGFATEYTVYEHTEELSRKEETFVETWIEDVACIETVFSDDISEDVVIDAQPSPKHNNLSECSVDDKNESLIYNDCTHMDKIKHIYGNEMCNNDAQLVETLYRTPQMDVRKTLVRRESQFSNESTRCYDNDSLERILSESNDKDEPISNTECNRHRNNVSCSNTIKSKKTQDDKENLEFDLAPISDEDYRNSVPNSDEDKACKSPNNIIHEPTQYDIVHSCESTCDYTISYKHKNESPRYSTSSSPEVSSTTSEEKCCGILLKITNCNGSISSQINDFNTKSTNKLNSKLTETKELIDYASNISRKRPLITKAAQKYIPPLKETIRDLKVKLPLPQHSLNKLKILKISKDKPKHDKDQIKRHNSFKPHFPKKSKPKFEDVLKSIDEIQIKMHKEKTKKQKHSIPKVVIKKNENGAHYASTSNNKDTFNPDLTGRKWQPWVFIEKNNFIDKMALNRKLKAIFNHRKNTYVLAENFRKYKSISDAKFVISQPKMEDISSGKLKYTIRLKHNY